MKPRFFLASAALVFASAAASAQVIKIDGSSTVFPVTEAVAEEFQVQQRGRVRVTVGISGTRGGFKKFCGGETDITNASRPILKSEMETCAQAGIKYIELPIAYDALTVVVNPKNTWVDAITLDELKKMWAPDAQGRIVSWRQVNPHWPDRPLRLFGAGSDSGTFDYFTEAIVGQARSSRSDYTASEDDNILVQGVESEPDALGYFGYAYYAPHIGKMKALRIVNSKGQPVLPSEQGVLDGSYEPLSRPVFIYVNADSARKPEVKAFVELYLTQGAPLIKEVRYVPLTAEAYELALGHFRNGKVGTAFNGAPEVRLSVEDLLTREGKL